MAIPDRIIDEILNKTDIVEVVQSHVPLRKAGANFKALCPFHGEKTPSFMVSPSKQIFHCFGCGAGGNAFGFLMKYDGLGFLEAVKLLADKSGVKIPQSKMNVQEKSDVLKFYELNKWAGVYFYKKLTKTREGEICLKYLLEERKIKPEIVKGFYLGFAPSTADDFLEDAKKAGYHESLLEQVGLIQKRRSGSGYIDKFRKRLIFPILDVKNRVVGFGGRVLYEGEPKYLNSPETKVYHKSEILYGLNVSKNAILREGWVIVVEGYMDLIALRNHGIKNVVASLGTSLTRGHIYKLKRYAKEVVMVYDSDKAGVAATLRGLDLLLEYGFRVRVVTLPKGEDPEDFINKNGEEKFLSFVKKSDGLIEYKMKVLSENRDAEILGDKIEIADDLLTSIARIPNEVEKRAYLKKLAEVLSLNEEAMLIEVKKIESRSPSYGERDVIISYGDPNVFEKNMIKLIIQNLDLFQDFKNQISSEDFQDSRCRVIIGTLLELDAKDIKLSTQSLINHIEEEKVKSLISKSLLEEVEWPNKVEALNSYIAKVKDMRLQREKEKLQKDIEVAEKDGREEEVINLLARYKELVVSKN